MSWIVRGLSAAILLVAVALAGAAVAQSPTADDIPPTALKAKLDPSLFAAVDGVSVRQYAHIVFDMFANDTQDADKTLAKYGLTKARFDKITAVMTDRMRQDKTFKFIDIYGAYYIEDAPGPFSRWAKDVANHVLNGAPLKEKPPYSMEDYMAIQGYYARKAPFAKDTSRASYDEILSEKGINFIDYSVLGSWYGKYMSGR